jgi:hypothetical protein
MCVAASTTGWRQVLHTAAENARMPDIFAAAAWHAPCGGKASESALCFSCQRKSGID